MDEHIDGDSGDGADLEVPQLRKRQRPARRVGGMVEQRAPELCFLVASSSKWALASRHVDESKPNRYSGVLLDKEVLVGAVLMTWCFTSVDVMGGSGSEAYFDAFLQEAKHLRRPASAFSGCLSYDRVDGFEMQEPCVVSSLGPHIVRSIAEGSTTGRFRECLETLKRNQNGGRLHFRVARLRPGFADAVLSGRLDNPIHFVLVPIGRMPMARKHLGQAPPSKILRTLIAPPIRRRRFAQRVFFKVQGTPLC